MRDEGDAVVVGETPELQIFHMDSGGGGMPEEVMRSQPHLIAVTLTVTLNLASIRSQINKSSGSIKQSWREESDSVKLYLLCSIFISLSLSSNQPRRMASVLAFQMTILHRHW